MTLAGARRRTYECRLRDEDGHEIVVRVVWPHRSDAISLVATALAVAEARQSARDQPFEVLEIEVGDTPGPARVRRFPAAATSTAAGGVAPPTAER